MGTSGPLNVGIVFRARKMQKHGPCPHGSHNSVSLISSPKFYWLLIRQNSLSGKDKRDMPPALKEFTAWLMGNASTAPLRPQGLKAVTDNRVSHPADQWGPRRPATALARLRFSGPWLLWEQRQTDTPTYTVITTTQQQDGAGVPWEPGCHSRRRGLL